MICCASPLTVTVDLEELEQRDVVRYIIREGPRVRVRAVEFRGETTFDSRLLMAEVKTKPQMFLFRKGELNEKVILDDVVDRVESVCEQQR